jgi:cytochrome o ubiquinol oxidase subunit 2
VNELFIPAGVPVHFALTSASVMNAFFIPQLGSMIYTMNGMATELNLHADNPGTLYGQSSHYSGDGFSDMHFDVHVLTPEGFTAWADSTKTTGPTLDNQSYAELAKQSIKVTPFTYKSFAPDLFDNIITQKLAPGPGPTEQTNPGATKQAEN